MLRDNESCHREQLDLQLLMGCCLMMQPELVITKLNVIPQV